MLNKLAVGLGILALAGIVGGLAFNSSRISIICRILANCESFKAPYDTALILNRDAKSSLANSVNIYDLRRVYKLAEKSSKAVSVAEIPNNYAEANILNSSNKELLDKVGDRINQEEKAEIYLNQAQGKAAEADTLSAASLGRLRKAMERIKEETAAEMDKLDRDLVNFQIKQSNEDTGGNISTEDIKLPGLEKPQPQKEMSREDEIKQQTTEYTKALSLYKESLKLIESISVNSFVDDKKTLLLKEYRDKVYSTEKFINSYLTQS